MQICPSCYLTQRQIKFGRNRSNTQRYKCTGCNRIYTPQKRTKYSLELKQAAIEMFEISEQAIDMRVDTPETKPRITYREIAEALNITHYQTVANWIRKYKRGDLKFSRKSHKKKHPLFF